MSPSRPASPTAHATGDGVVSGNGASLSSGYLRRRSVSRTLAECVPSPAAQRYRHVRHQSRLQIVMEVIAEPLRIVISFWCVRVLARPCASASCELC